MGFPCPTIIHHDGYFSRPLCDFFRFYMNFVSSAYFFFRFFCVCSNLKNKFTNEFSRCRNGCKHSLAPKNGSEIAFQASVWDHCWYQYLLTKTSWRQTVSLTCVTLLVHLSGVRNVVDIVIEMSFNIAKMVDALKAA